MKKTLVVLTLFSFFNFNMAEENKEKKVQITSDKLVVLKDKKIMILEGNVCVQQEENILKAQKIKYDKENKMVYAKGNVEYKDKEKMFFGEYFKYNIDKEQGICSAGTIKMKPYYCQGSPIKRLSNDKVYIENGTFTTCELEHPHYWFKAAKIMLYPKDKIVAKKIKMYLLKIPLPPIFYWPFYTKSLKPKPTGLEFNYGYENYKGFYFRNEYKYDFKNFLYGSAWLEFTSNMDICFGGKQEADYKFNIKHDKKILSSAYGSFNGSYDEKGEKDPFTQNIKKSKRWNLSWSHKEQFPLEIDNRCNVEAANITRYDASQVKTYEELLKNELISNIYFEKNFSGQNINLNFYRQFDIKDEKERIYLPKISYTKYSSTFMFLENFRKKHKIPLPKISYNLEGDYINYRLQEDYDKENKYYKTMHNEIGADGILSLKSSTELLNWLNITAETKIEQVFRKVIKEKPEVKKYENLPINFYKWTNSIQLKTTFYKIFNIQFFNFFKGMKHSVSPEINYSYLQRTDFKDNEPIFKYSLPNISYFPGGNPVRENLDLELNNDIQVKQLRIEIDDEGKEIKRDWSKKLDLVKLTNSVNFNYDYNLNIYKLSTPLNSTLIIKPLEIQRKVMFIKNLFAETNIYMNLGFLSTYDFETRLFEKKRLDITYNYYKNIYKKKEFEEEKQNLSLNTALIFCRSFDKQTYRDTFRIQPLKIDFNILKGIKLNYATYIDFTNKDNIFSSHEFGLVKSLHCWQLTAKILTIRDRIEYQCLLGIKELMPGAIIQWHEETIKK